MADLVWTLRIREDLNAFANYIATDSAAYAFAFLRRIIEAAEHLRAFPEMGRVVPEFEDESIRELIVQNYRVVYVFRDGVVYMAAAKHGAMDIRRTLGEPWELV